MRKLMPLILVMITALILMIFVMSCSAPSEIETPESEVSPSVTLPTLIYPEQPTDMTSSSQYRNKLTSVIHDNEFLLHENGWWYTMWTNTTLMRRSQNLLLWESVTGGRKFAAKLDLSWAPCMIRLPIGPDGTMKYCFYESSTYGFGSQHSRIILWASDYVDRGYEMVGTVIRSGTNHGDTTSPGTPASAGYPNCIDADVLFDKDGGLWMTYGSFFGGLFIIELDPNTGLLKNGEDVPGTRIAYRGAINRAIEGPDIIYNPETDYYYLTLAYDSLEHTYNTRIARSKDITGPYLDYNGNDVNNTTITASNGAQAGTLLISPYYFTGDIGWSSTGHASMIYDERTDEYFITYNNRPGSGGSVVLGVRKVFWTDDGWPVTIPAYFTGLDNPGKERQGQEVPSDLIPGDYEVIRNTRATRQASVRDARIASEPVTLNADGTVTGTYTGTWEQVRGDKISMKLNHDGSDFTYDLYLIASWDYENWCPTIYFTGYSEAAAGSGNDNAGVLLQGKCIN